MKSEALFNSLMARQLTQERRIGQIYRNKKGAIAVLLSMTFASMLIIVSTLVNAAGFAAGRSMAGAAADIAGRSVLAGYDRQLKQDYGIFAFKGSVLNMENDIFNDIQLIVCRKNDQEEFPSADILAITAVSADVTLKGHSIIDLSIFEDQLTEQMKYRVLFKDLIKFQQTAGEMSTGIFLTELTGKIMAIVKDLNELKTWIQNIDTAQAEIEKCEARLLSELNGYGEPSVDVKESTVYLADISYLLASIRKNDEIILFNVGRIKRISGSLLEAIESAECFFQNNQESCDSGAAKEVLESVRPARNLLKRLESSYSDQWVQPFNENIALLKTFESQPSSVFEADDAFIQRYHWDLEATFLDQFDFESLFRSEGIKSISRSGAATSEAVSDIDNTTGRALKNDSVLQSLPSHEFGGKKNSIEFQIPTMDEIQNIRSLMKKGRNLFLVDRYIMTYMTNNLMEFDSESHFFRNEVEYILYGHTDDLKNLDEFKRNLNILRTGMNIAHLYGDPSKRGAAEALAASLSPGPFAGLTEFAIIAIWAEAEAINDVDIIESGGNVPLLKANDDWALTLENLLDKTDRTITVSSNKGEGWTYARYLELFLLLTDRKDKLLRTMDIIQINMQGRHNKGFYLKERHCGFDYKILLERNAILPGFNRARDRTIELEGEHAY